jgi:hypothetical protein
MEELMERMQDLLEDARRQGIAEAAKAVRDYLASLDRDEYDVQYLDGMDDAACTIEQM